MYSNWNKRIVEWQDNDRVYLSIVFTWQLQEAYQRAIFRKSQGYEVVVGGPAVKLFPTYFDGVAVLGKDRGDVLYRHNPDATFTSRGCIRKCPFCAVPRIEGELKELEQWDIKPIVCDNNLLACSSSHFNKVIDSLKLLHNVDFNQGLDARLLNKEHAQRLSELDLYCVRFAFDHINSETSVMQAIETIKKVGIPARKIRVYVLIGYNDTPQDALYRLELIRGMGMFPNPMRYQPLDSPKRNSYIAEGWADRELKRMSRFYSLLQYFKGMSYEQYSN